MKTKLNEKGFTLIELLAVITIMAILLLVGIPAISSTIFKSRKNTVETSVKSYANEVNKEILSHEIANSVVEDGTYSIMKNGNICLATYDPGSDSCPGQILEVQMEGSLPEGGQVEIFNKKVVAVYNVVINNFYVNSENNSSYVASTEPEEVKKTLCRTTGDTNYDLGTLYTCEVAEGVKYDFRILSTNGDTVNMLMTENLPGVRTAWFNWGTGSGINYNNCGPVQAYEAISNATSGWTNLKDINFQYSTGDIRIVFSEDKGSFRVYSKEPDCTMYGADFDSMKARMPNYSELAALSSEWYTNGTTECAVDDAASGYWLNDPFTSSIIGSTHSAHAVGAPHCTSEEVMWHLGIRPVIQVSRSDLS